MEKRQKLFDTSGSIDDLEAVSKALEGVHGAWVNMDSNTLGQVRETYTGIRIFELAKDAGTVRHFVFDADISGSFRPGLPPRRRNLRLCLPSRRRARPHDLPARHRLLHALRLRQPRACLRALVRWCTGMARVSWSTFFFTKVTGLSAVYVRQTPEE